jgi:nitroreductase
MAPWRKRLFLATGYLAADTVEYFKLPRDRTARRSRSEAVPVAKPRDALSPAGLRYGWRPMDVEEAIRTRRTHKVFAPDAVPRELLDELFDLARWAPNHHLTNPWRFRVIGPVALARLKEAAGTEGASKLDRAPTLVAASMARAEDPVQDQDDLCATACAVYVVLLAAHARGLAGYWRTPAMLRTRPGQHALGIPPTERFVALIHLGWPRQEKESPPRLPAVDLVSYLD